MFELEKAAHYDKLKAEMPQTVISAMQKAVKESKWKISGNGLSLRKSGKGNYVLSCACGDLLVVNPKGRIAWRYEEPEAARPYTQEYAEELNDRINDLEKAGKFPQGVTGIHVFRQQDGRSMTVSFDTAQDWSADPVVLARPSKNPENVRDVIKRIKCSKIVSPMHEKRAETATALALEKWREQAKDLEATSTAAHTVIGKALAGSKLPVFLEQVQKPGPWKDRISCTSAFPYIKVFVPGVYTFRYVPESGSLSGIDAMEEDYRRIRSLKTGIQRADQWLKDKLVHAPFSSYKISAVKDSVVRLSATLPRVSGSVNIDITHSYKKAVNDFIRDLLKRQQEAEKNILQELKEDALFGDIRAWCILGCLQAQRHALSETSIVRMARGLSVSDPNANVQHKYYGLLHPISPDEVSTVLRMLEEDDCLDTVFRSTSFFLGRVDYTAYRISDKGRRMFETAGTHIHRKPEDYNDMEVLALIKTTDPGTLSKTRAASYSGLIASHPLVICREPDTVREYVSRLPEEARELFSAMTEMEEELHRRRLLRSVCPAKEKKRKQRKTDD